MVSDSIFPHKILAACYRGGQGQLCSLLPPIIHKSSLNQTVLNLPLPKHSHVLQPIIEQDWGSASITFQAGKGEGPEASFNIGHIPSWIVCLHSCNFNELWNSNGVRIWRMLTVSLHLSAYLKNREKHIRFDPYTLKKSVCFPPTVVGPWIASTAKNRHG